MNKKKGKIGKCSTNKCGSPNKPTNGKGDKPRSISKRFKKNYDAIDWDNRKKKNL